MDRRTFLHALFELGFGDASTDWANAQDIEVRRAWKKWRQTPLIIDVSAAGRLMCGLCSTLGWPEGISRSVSAPRYKMEQNAYWLFNTLGSEVRQTLDVALHDSHTETGWCFAQLGSSIDKVNAAAQFADIPLRLERTLSAAEAAWERQVQSGKVVGMDDPVWMAKTQEQIDAHLDWLFGIKKGL